MGYQPADDVMAEGVTISYGCPYVETCDALGSIESS